MKKNKLFNIAAIGLAFGLTLSTASCTDYLDKSPDSDVDATAAFKNYKNFQGFIEEIYKCIPDKESCFWCTSFNWGEDEIFNDGDGNSHFSMQMDLGNYRNWQSNAQHYFGGYDADPTSDNKFNHRIYGHAWYCIRKCNLGLENLGLLVNATDEEKKIIEGQLYFFRGWWHNEMMQYLGGLPYLESTVDAGAKMDAPRMGYRECLLKAAADFEKAANLLPKDWDKTTIGGVTKGHNQARVTRTAALGYAAKCYLWAASPLTANDKAAIAPQPSSNTYAYDKEMASKAASLYKTALSEVESGQTPYALHKFDYKDVYTHTENATKDNNFHEIFYTSSQNWLTPGGTECIMRGPDVDVNKSNWNFAKLWGSKVDGLVAHDKIIHQPTANYINYAYGMKNGKPAYVVENGELKVNTASGFDPTHPFKDRDPRFYHDIVFDGERLVETTIKDDKAERQQQYMASYTGGYLRQDDKVGARTGYFCQKLVGKQANKFDELYEWKFALQCYLPYMRLGELYISYAEAAAASGNDAEAVKAVNVLRARVGADPTPYSSGNELMEAIRRERACELAFEGFRWNDLQRWCLLDKKPYTTKMSQELVRKMGDETLAGDIVVENAWYRENDPAEAEVSNFTMKEIRPRNLSTKHYWFPWPDSEVYIYDAFSQNPGW